MSALEKFSSGVAEFFARLSFKTKIVVFLFTILFILWLDNQTGFTYHYFTSRKIDEIKNYKEILKDTSLTSYSKGIIENEFISAINKTRGFKLNQIQGESVLFHLSYSWILLFMILFIKKLIAAGSKGQSTDSEISSQSVSVSIILILEILILYFVANYLSSYIKNNVVLYLINSAMQILILAFTFFLANVYERKKKRR